MFMKAVFDKCTINGNTLLVLVPAHDGDDVPGCGQDKDQHSPRGRGGGRAGRGPGQGGHRHPPLLPGPRPPHHPHTIQDHSEIMIHLEIFFTSRNIFHISKFRKLRARAARRRPESGG